MAALQALIWDVDGTLAETERDGHRVAFNAAFKSLGLDWHWGESRYGDLLEVTGGRERLLRDMDTRADAPSDPAERDAMARLLHALKNKQYAAIVAAGHIPLRAGVAALMADCRLAGLPMAIATTTSRSNVDALMGAHFGPGWESGFAAVLCAEDAPVKKPDPLVYRLTLERLDLPPEAVLAVEDSPAGVGACLAARVPVVVTRSVYFGDFPAEGALAVGAGLHDRRTWVPGVPRPGKREAPLPEDGRVDLDLLCAWHARRTGSVVLST